MTFERVLNFLFWLNVFCVGANLGVVLAGEYLLMNLVLVPINAIVAVVILGMLLNRRKEKH